MNKGEAKEALVRANRIIDQWEENELESYEAMELLAPLLKTITAHFERVLDPAAGSSSDQDLKEEESEAAIEKEKEAKKGEEGDLFSKSEDQESKDESKSKSKKRKFAGSNGEIPF